MLLLIGFENEEIEKLKEIFKNVIAVSKDMEEMKLSEVIEKKEEGRGGRLGQQRIVIMHDIPKEEIGSTINSIKKMIDKHIIFATSTPTSLQWKIRDLVEELLEEDRYFRSRSK